MDKDIDVGVIVRKRFFIEMPELDDLLFAKLLPLALKSFCQRPGTRNQKAKVAVGIFRKDLHHFDKQRNVLFGRDPSGIKQKHGIAGHAGAFDDLAADHI